MCVERRRGLTERRVPVMSRTRASRCAPSPASCLTLRRGRDSRVARAPGRLGPRRHARRAAVDVRVGHAQSRLSVGSGRSVARSANAGARLFDFIYQTYDSSAWIPQSLFDGNLVTQAVVGDVDTIVGEKVGLVLWREQSVVPAYGMAPEPPVGPAAALDGELPRVPHRRNRRRRVPRRGHQDLRRPAGSARRSRR